MREVPGVGAKLANAIKDADALDADLEDATALNADVLRHTCIAWLVRQGVRFSDLASRVGRISADALIGYSGLTPKRESMEEAEICWIMPALRDDAAG